MDSARITRRFPDAGWRWAALALGAAAIYGLASPVLGASIHAVLVAETVFVVMWMAALLLISRRG